MPKVTAGIIVAVLMFITATVHAASGKFVDYEVDGLPYEGYYVDPGEGAPFVLLIHDWDGLTDYEVKRAEMLGELGYRVFAADLFGKGVRPEAEEDRRKLTRDLYADRKKMRALMFGALTTVENMDVDVENAVATGYCFGGAAVLELARSGADMRGFVPFHGGLKTPDGQDYSRVQGKVLVFHGTADASVSMEEFSKLARDLEAAGVEHEMITYGGAVHAFTVFDRPERYNEVADKQSWKRFVAFLEEELK
ncbi:MAG: dienelactone hydrolase family protein [Candidatus Omnitrophica bacterium]|nr:dienelactone hydrolase family protein [Candidatus Omnitrophota bacterium]